VASGVMTIAGQAKSLSVTENVVTENVLDAVWEVSGVIDVRDRLSCWTGESRPPWLGIPVRLWAHGCAPGQLTFALPSLDHWQRDE
jgi:hypothetical protein